MQLDIPCLLETGGVPISVANLAFGARKVEIDLHLQNQNGHSDPVISIDNLCIILHGTKGINWNRDDGVIHIEYHED